MKKPSLNIKEQLRSTIFEKEIPESSLLCQTYHYLGQCQHCIGNYRDAVECFGKALEVKSEKSYKFIGACHHRIAVSLQCTGCYSKAIMHYQKAIDINERESPGVGSTVLAMSLAGLATVNFSLGNFHHAESLFERSFAILPCLDSKSEAIGVVNFQYGTFCMEMEEWGKAFESFKCAKQYYLLCKNLAQIAACQREMAMILIHQNRFNKSTERALDLALNQAAEVQTSRGKRQTCDLAVTYIAKGILFMAQKDYENASVSLSDSERILALKAPHSFEFAKMCIITAELMVAKKNPISAIQRYEQALAVYELHNSTSPMKRRILDSIEVLEIQVAKENEERTGIQTAIAKPIIMSPSNSPCYPRFKDQAQTVLAVPMDSTFCANEFPLVAQISRDQLGVKVPATTTYEGKNTTNAYGKQPVHVQEAGKRISPCCSVDSDSMAATAKKKVAARNKLKLLAVMAVNGDDVIKNKLHSLNGEKFDVTLIFLQSMSQFLHDVRAMGPDVVVTQLAVEEDERCFGNTIGDLPQGLQLIHQLRKNGMLTPIIIWASSRNDVEQFRDETMRIGGNGIIVDEIGLCAILEKFLNDLVQENL